MHHFTLYMYALHPKPYITAAHPSQTAFGSGFSPKFAFQFEIFIKTTLYGKFRVALAFHNHELLASCAYYLLRFSTQLPNEECG